MARIVVPCLTALFDRLIDYAGMFPPATLSCAAVIDNYQRYRSGQHAWMLRWLVVATAELEHVPRNLDGSLAVLSDVDEPRAAVIEAKRIVRSERPTYCEAPPSDLDEVQRAGCFAKFRAGAVTPGAIPAVPDLAAFILACAERRLPFKVTAGLHHPIRALHPLTYQPNPPRAIMHGFLNVFLAAAFAWQGKRNIEPILAETDPNAFRFDERAQWRDWSLEAYQIREVRQRFAHSFGSCSFDEPVEGLQALGLL
jgi:hypothetical protein